VTTEQRVVAKQEIQEVESAKRGGPPYAHHRNQAKDTNTKLRQGRVYNKATNFSASLLIFFFRVGSHTAFRLVSDRGFQLGVFDSEPRDLIPYPIRFGPNPITKSCNRGAPCGAPSTNQVGYGWVSNVLNGIVSIKTGFYFFAKSWVFLPKKIFNENKRKIT
jgi:hypothetical protein